jgi:hypothetical protein
MKKEEPQKHPEHNTGEGGDMKSSPILVQKPKISRKH